MARHITTSDAKLERLMGALDAYNSADRHDDGSHGAAKDCIRAQNVLLDTCIECGMSHDEDEFTWAATVVGYWLLRAA